MRCPSGAVANMPQLTSVSYWFPTTWRLKVVARDGGVIKLPVHSVSTVPTGPGQPGATLEMTDRPDEVAAHEPGRCCGCGAGLADARRRPRGAARRRASCLVRIGRLTGLFTASDHERTRMLA